MSDDDTSSPARPIPPTAGTEMASLRFVRMSLRPPAKFSPGSDFKLWLTRFEMYVRQAEIAEAQRVQELLSLLEDEPFRVVSQQDLLGTDDYDSVTKCLRQHYAPDGNELEWQYKLQTRTQKPGERLADFAGALRVLAEKAYLKWSVEQRQEVLRSQFVQGIRSSSVQLWLMREMPESMEEALKIASKQETVENAQRRLHKEKQLGVDHESILTLDVEQEPQASANAIQSRRPSELEELKTQMKQLVEEVAQLRGERSAGKRGPVCWGCRQRGHIRCNCPNQRSSARHQGREQPLN